MDDDARRARIRQFADAISTADMDVFDAMYHDDVVIEWPQSGEVIHGKKNIRELRLAHPTPPAATLRRVVGSGDLWAMEMVFDYGGDRFHVIPSVPRGAGGKRDVLLRGPIPGARLAGQVGRASAKLRVELTPAHHRNQVEISANNVGGVPGDGVWLWIGLNRNGSGGYTGADCIHTGPAGLNGAGHERGDVTWTDSGGKLTTPALAGVPPAGPRARPGARS